MPTRLSFTPLIITYIIFFFFFSSSKLSICSWSSSPSRLSPKQPFYCFLSLSSSPFMHSPPLNTPWNPHLHLLEKLSFTSSTADNEENRREVERGRRSKADAGWARVVAAAVHVEMREVHAMQAGARAGAARNAGHGRVLPRSLEVQVWQQVVHALMPLSIKYIYLDP